MGHHQAGLSCLLKAKAGNTLVPLQAPPAPPQHPKALLAGETPVPCAVGVHGQKSRQRGSEPACPAGDGAHSQSHPLE